MDTNNVEITGKFTGKVHYYRTDSQVRCEGHVLVTTPFGHNNRFKVRTTGNRAPEFFMAFEEGRKVQIGGTLKTGRHGAAIILVNSLGLGAPASTGQYEDLDNMIGKLEQLKAVREKWFNEDCADASDEAAEDERLATEEEINKINDLAERAEAAAAEMVSTPKESEEDESKEMPPEGYPEG